MSLEISSIEPPKRCACGTELSESLLVCPTCDRLVHRERLEALAARAREAEAKGDPVSALTAWREALELLPADASQARAIAERVATLRDQVPVREGGDPEPFVGEAPARGKIPKALASMGVFGALLWKGKALLFLVLGKAKLVLLGLTKLGTLTSMLASFGVYWAAWGWPLAAGLLLSIYLHEMGHVAALARLGFKVNAPMFVPGVGAFVRLRQRPVDGVEDARIGLAGPLWGLGAALAAAALWSFSGSGLALAVCRLGAWINLFNLLPLGPLDGGRGFRALGRGGRFLVTLALAGAYLWTRDGLLLILVIVAAARLFGDRPPASDRRALAEYLILVGALSALLLLPAPVQF